MLRTSSKELPCVKKSKHFLIAAFVLASRLLVVSTLRASANECASRSSLSLSVIRSGEIVGSCGTQVNRLNLVSYLFWRNMHLGMRLDWAYSAEFNRCKYCFPFKPGCINRYHPGTLTLDYSSCTHRPSKGYCRLKRYIGGKRDLLSRSWFI